MRHTEQQKKQAKYGVVQYLPMREILDELERLDLEIARETMALCKMQGE